MALAATNAELIATLVLSLERSLRTIPMIEREKSIIMRTRTMIKKIKRTIRTIEKAFIVIRGGGAMVAAIPMMTTLWFHSRVCFVRIF